MGGGGEGELRFYGLLMLKVKCFNMCCLINFDQHFTSYPRFLVLDDGSSDHRYILTLKTPVTTAADDIHKYFFIVFQRK